MLTLFCLGNPTIKHKNNRHNAGLLLGEFLVDKLELKLKKFKNFKLTNTFHLDGHQCQIALSENYMNESGLAVNKIKSFFKIKSEDIFVIYDDLDLALGRIKLKKAGGDAGHNGIKSIDRHIQDHYYKIRIGISRPTNQISISHYVLSDFHQTEIEKLQPALLYICSNITELIQKDFPKFLNDYYTKFHYYNLI